MRLEKLEVQGFKSFADKIDFAFEPGLTAFVGPNGCGKSNVVDAVKWVLGEQSAKSLRGNEMQDVIFDGTPTRRSAGYAEVSLTFSNTKGIMNTDYESVSVTRRLYRSGESEYYLNKQRCRLKDIRDLFSGTGVGIDAYSMIEQGKVDALVTSNKQDRRIIFEEAAGISKYKQQKKTCLNKLDRVNNNLLRLGDIIDEVEKRMRSVNYQAAKARRWKKLEEQRRDLAITLALHQYIELIQAKSAALEGSSKLNGEVGGLQASLELMEAGLSELETALIDASQKISKLQSDDARVMGQLHGAEESIRMNEARMAELDALEERSKREVEASQNSLTQMNEEFAATEAESAEITRMIDSGRVQLDAAREAIKAIDTRLREIKSEIDELRSAAVGLASEKAQKNNELSAIAAQRDQMMRQDARLSERIAERKQNLEESGSARELLSRKCDDTASEIRSYEQARSGREMEREQAEQLLEKLSGEINEKRSSLAGIKSRAELLRDLEEKSEGIGAGVKHLLEISKAENPPLSGICGAVADIINVDVAHARAVEAALGAYDQLVLAESYDAMTAAMQYLADNGKGRASFMPLTVSAGEPAHMPEGEGIVGIAVSLIRRDEKYSNVLRKLLGNVVVVSDISKAKELSSANSGAFRYATLDGQLLDPNGISTGGSASAAPGVISRRSELRSLETEIASTETALAALTSQIENVRGIVAQAKHNTAELAVLITKKTAELSDARAEMAKIESALSRIQSELEACESERSEIAGHIEMLSGRDNGLRAEAQKIELAENDLRTRLTKKEHLQNEAEGDREQAQGGLTELEVSQAQRNEKAESLAKRREELVKQIEYRKRAVESATAEIENCRTRRTEAAETIQARKTDINGHLAERTQIGAERAAAQEEHNATRAQLEKTRDERNAAARRTKEAEAELNRLNIQATEIAMRIENLESRAASEYSCSLADKAANYEPPAEADWTQIEQEVETLSQKMKAMGAVNTYAIDELDELEKRFTELTTQRDDLQKAEATLKEIIRKINKHSRELFQKTFEDVRENFQSLFRKIFGGGRADIVLEAEMDILDAGIDIIACPPGKEPSSITLLSGGEKALTAIALLFAIFRSKPSPFCILDEVDAPLDENNIERFTMLVREFLKESQFLVITHSRRTMAMADALYGITMQEPGISTKISVKFAEEADKSEAAVAGD